ncbi:MAG TPA: class I SAM-dependent methyltransferase [Gemmatimonadaceae bacterium]|jgi:ubiquinone/menaquinone biosynthesis C-methylase UbiE
MTQPADELRRQFGEIDIYLFDQLLRGRITRGMRILDAGCGGGRNLVYLLREGFEVWGLDESAEAIEQMRILAANLAPGPSRDRFSVGSVEKLPYADASMNVVISSAVLHFARDERQWTAMVDEMWRVLSSGGVLFSRLATTIGQEGMLESRGGRRYVQLDGTERFLVDEAMLMATTARLGATLLDPLKTSVVQNLRSMATWVIRKD